MFILSALLQAVIVSIVIIIVLFIPIFFILGKFKNKDKVSLKGVKTVVFNLNELVEDYMISTISINKTLSHEALLKALENLVNDKKIEKIIIDVDEVDLSRVHIEEIKEIFEKLSVNKEIIAKGLVLRINSPGGSALESEKIYQKLKKLEVPIYVSMGDLCASGDIILQLLVKNYLPIL